MRFNPKARLDTGRVHDAAAAVAAAWAAAGCGSRSRAAARPAAASAASSSSCSWCSPSASGGGTGGGGRCPTAASTRAGSAARHRPLRQLQDRRGRQRGRRLRPDRGRELPLRLLGATTLPEQAGTDVPARRRCVTFTGGVDTGCGAATSQVGPFYCPPDETIYLDTTFFDDVLEQQLGGPDGDFVEPYVLAHEYGHHIQNLIGTMGQVPHPAGPDERRRPARAAGRLLRRHVDRAAPPATEDARARR